MYEQGCTGFLTSVLKMILPNSNTYSGSLKLSMKEILRE